MMPNETAQPPDPEQVQWDNPPDSPEFEVGASPGKEGVNKEDSGKSSVSEETAQGAANIANDASSAEEFKVESPSSVGRSDEVSPPARARPTSPVETSELAAESERAVTSRRSSIPKPETEQPPEVRLGKAVWKNQDTDQPVTVVGRYGEADGRQYVKIEGSDTGVPLDEIEYPAESPVESVPTELPPSRLPEGLPQISSAPSSARVEPPPLPEGFDVEEAVQSGTLKPWGKDAVPKPDEAHATETRLQEEKQTKIPAEQIHEHRERFEQDKDRIKAGRSTSVRMQRDLLKTGQDVGYEVARGKESLKFEAYKPEDEKPFVFVNESGEKINLQERDVDRLIKRKIEKENKEITQELKAKLKAKEEDIQKEADKPTEEFNKTRERLKEGKGTSVRMQRDFLKSGQDVGYELQKGQQTLKFEAYNPEDKKPFVFTDQESNKLQLPEKEVDKLIKSRLENENKEITEELKPTSRWKERLDSLRNASPVINGLYRIGNSFLNKFDWRDKEKGWWIAGIIVGAGSNVGLTFALPFLGFGPGRLIRSAVSSGALLGISYGVNRFRNFSIANILENYGVKDTAEKTGYTKKFDSAFRFLRMSKEQEYHDAMKNLSTEIFTKYGTADHKGNVEMETNEEGARLLQERIEKLNTKYQKLNNKIRSFSAGLAAGSIGATVGFGLYEKVLEPAFDRIFHHGEGPAVPAGSEHAPPEGTTGQTPDTQGPPQGPEIHGGENLPSGTEGASPGVTPEVTPNVPHLADLLNNPENSNLYDIKQGDTLGQVFLDHGHGDATLWEPIPDNAHRWGAQLALEHDKLKGWYDAAAGAGYGEPGFQFPTQAELPSLIESAAAGNAADMHRLVEAHHFIQTGGNINLVTPAGIEAINKAIGVRV